MILVVDDHDIIIGEEDKEKCHDNPGRLHRGFLAMVYTRSGELLLTRRSDKKRLWPGFWDGSVASHVYRGEDYLEASRRRLAEELGVASAPIEFGFKFHYRAGYGSAGTEHEICAVTIVRGIDADRLTPDPDEIAEIKTADLKALIEEIRAGAGQYTPWLILALNQISERPFVDPVGLQALRC